MGRSATPEGDPARTMELLWGGGSTPISRPRNGKPGLTLDRIVEAAISVADAEGLDAVSMRRLAAELGAGAMSLYTHVPGKTELVEVMLDRALSTLEPADDTEAGGGSVSRPPLTTISICCAPTRGCSASSR